jgi:NADH:ubiquinone oxidoreductase subunit 2 (subunit N)
MYFVSASSENCMKVSFGLKVVLVGSCIMVLLIGIFPQYFIEFVQLSNNLIK